MAHLGIEELLALTEGRQLNVYNDVPAGHRQPCHFCGALTSMRGYTQFPEEITNFKGEKTWTRQRYYPPNCIDCVDKFCDLIDAEDDAN